MWDELVNVWVNLKGHTPGNNRNMECISQGDLHYQRAKT